MSVEPVIWTPVRTRLREWFRHNAPSLQCVYEGAVHLIHVHPLPGRHLFIAVAIREIIDKLPYIIGKDIIGERLNYSKLVNLIADNWIEHVDDDAQQEAEPVGDISISSEAFIEVDKLIRAHRKHPVQRDRNKKLLQELMSRKSLDGSMPMDRLEDAINESHEWAVPWMHARTEVYDLPADDEVVNQFLEFERTLHFVVGQFFVESTELDEILQATNASGS
jgi:hypothetical protein